MTAELRRFARICHDCPIRIGTAERVRSNRRLAVILAADVFGYSGMKGADEAGTLAALKRHREALFNPAVAEHNGRVVKLIGDGMLVEFSSVVDAVKMRAGRPARRQGAGRAGRRISFRACDGTGRLDRV